VEDLMAAPNVTSGGTHARVSILGVRVSALTLDTAISVIERWIADRSANYVCITGAHGIIASRSDENLRRIHNEAGMVTPDGMPLVFMARRLGFKSVSRVYGPALMRRLTQISASKGYRQYYYGGGPGLVQRLAWSLAKQHPELQVAGTFAPPFRPLTKEEDDAVVAGINAAAPDILWVGLSTPKQELWMASHVRRLNVPVLIGVGAAFDFLAGTKRQAPAWIQNAGLEWAYRLASEPRRLWRRYAKIVPLFLFLAGVQIVRRSVRPEKKRAVVGGP
jgi:N-acetylglucosaminyldiphosphoundecaprenol N-acetyl-beta-D-mannosaminyltransferase